MTKAKIEYGVVPKELWDQPEWIDKEKADKTREQMDKDGIVFGGTFASGLPLVLVKFTAYPVANNRESLSP